MAEVKNMRLNKVLREFNISLDRAVEFLSSKGFEVESRPTTKISGEEYQVLFDEFQTDKSKKVASKEVSEEKRKEKEEIRLAYEKEHEDKLKKETSKVIKAEVKIEGPKKVGKIDLDTVNPVKKKPEAVKETPPVTKVSEEKPKKETKTPPVTKVSEEKPKKETKTPTKTTPAKTTKKPPVKKVVKKEVLKETVKEEPKPTLIVEEIKKPERVETKYKKLDGPRITGEKIDLTQFKKPEKKKVEKKEDEKKEKRSRRRRISKGPARGGRGNNKNKGQKRTHIIKEEPSEAEVQKQVRETLEKLQGKSSKGKGAKYRREKRDVHRQKSEDELLVQQEMESKQIKVTEFVTVSEIATMMDVPVTEIISACMSLGMMVTMNQRLDAETLTIVAEEFDYTVEFITADLEESIQEVEDAPEDLEPRDIRARLAWDTGDRQENTYPFRAVFRHA